LSGKKFWYVFSKRHNKKNGWAGGRAAEYKLFPSDSENEKSQGNEKRLFSVVLHLA
jgi:hypothetical protein